MERWPLNKAYFWETAPFFRLLPPLIAGIVLPLFVPSLINTLYSRYLPVFLVIFFLLFVGAALIPKQIALLKWVNSLLFHATLFSLGWLLYLQNDVKQDPTWFGHSVGNSKAFVVRIVKTPAEKEKTWRLDVSVIGSIGNTGIRQVTGPSILYVYKDTGALNLHNGDTLLIPDKWQPIKNAGNPFEFDYAAYCARNNLYYRQLLSPAEIKLYNTGSITIADKVHDWCMTRLAAYLPSPQVKGLIQAMLVGDETNLDPGLRDSYAATGIVHIIAISGGNITLFFIMVTWLLGWLRHRKHLWVKYLIALPLIWFYVVMAGNSPSAVRAAFMFTIIAAGIALQKHNNPLNLLFTTAFLLICANPVWVLSIGFQLSFIAVLSLILFYKPLYSLYHPGNKIVKKLWSAIASAIAAEILVAPVVIYYFHIFPLFFIVANVAAFLFMEWVLVLGIVLIILSLVPVLAGAVGWFITLTTNSFDDFVSWLQVLNPEAFNYLCISIAELLCVYMLIAGISVLLSGKHKTGAFVSLFSLCFLLALLCRDEYFALCQRRLVVYNINGIAHIELVNGKHYQTLYTDGAYGDAEVARIVKPAHIAWHAWHQDVNREERETLIVAHTNILILKQPMAIRQAFPIDCIIMTWPYKPNSKISVEKFSPHLVIVANNLANRKTGMQVAPYITSVPYWFIRNDGGRTIGQ